MLLDIQHSMTCSSFILNVDSNRFVTAQLKLLLLGDVAKIFDW